MKYFEFEFIEIVNEKVANKGEALYYTSGEQNSDEMKNLAREIIKKPAAVISIISATEIDRGTFI